MYEKVHELVWIKLNESKCTVKQWKKGMVGCFSDMCLCNFCTLFGQCISMFIPCDLTNGNDGIMTSFVLYYYFCDYSLSLGLLYLLWVFFLFLWFSLLTLWRRNFLLNFSTRVYKIWIIQETKKVTLWNKRHFVEEKTESMQHV